MLFGTFINIFTQAFSMPKDVIEIVLTKGLFLSQHVSGSNRIKHNIWMINYKKFYVELLMR